MAFDGCSAEIAEKLKKAGLEPTFIAVPAHPGKIIFWGFLPGLDDMPTQFWNEVSKVLFPGEATDKARPSTNLNIFEVAQQNQMYTTTHLISYTYLAPPILQVVFDDNKSNIILQNYDQQGAVHRLANFFRQCCLFLRSDFPTFFSTPFYSRETQSLTTRA